MNRFQRSFTSHFPALMSRDYAIFWVGQFLSVIGTWAQNTTLPYLAYQITGSSLDLGLIGFATTLPMLFVTLPAGVIVEHLDKRKTVIVMQSVMMLQAFTLAALTIGRHIQIWHITVLAFVLGTASAIEITARQAMLIELAGREALPNAIAVQTTAFNLGRVIGPTLAAGLLTLNNGAGMVFLSNGISYIFVIGGLFFVRTRYQVPREATRRQNLRAEFGEGQHYIRQNPLVSQIILMMAVVGFFGFPLLQQIPAIAKDVLAQAADTEQIVAARNSALYTFQGIGALVAAFSIAFFTSFKKRGIWLTFGQYTFVLALIVLSFMQSALPAYILLMLIGWGMVTQLAIMNVLIQVQVPNRLRGRVFSTYLWAIQGVAPFGSLLIGWWAQAWGVPRTLLICGLIILVILSVLHILTPDIRKSQA
ncbi:MAG: MFS transporter [Anaerolineales bacterium]|jgi:MFS family permease